MRRKIHWLFLMILLVILFRGYLFRWLITYQQAGTRSIQKLDHRELEIEIDELTAEESIDLSKAIKIAKRLNNRQLTFVFNPSPQNPNVVARTGRANCVGYAGLYCAILDRLLLKAGLQNCEVQHVVGKIHFLGFDLHRLFDDPFWTDHDYCRIINNETEEEVCVDPSLNDYFNIGRIRAVRQP